MKKWEYLYRYHAPATGIMVSLMNELGMDGWEIFHIQYEDNWFRLWAKRELREGNHDQDK
jgi:hypothetical protein